MKIKRLVSILLLLGMLITQLVACGEAAVDTPDTTDASTTSTEAAATDTERLSADIPADLDYEGYEFRILARGLGNSWENYDLVAETSNGEVVNDAIYKRNLAVAELLNVKFVHEPVNAYDISSPVKQSIMSDSDDYDIVMPRITDAANLAQQGMFTPLQELPYIDFSKPWYDQRCIEELEIKGKNYMFFSDITVANLDAIWIYVFNKTMIDDFELTDPYELVADGSWTMDKMTEMCKATTYDLNGDGAMTKEDRWGIVGHDYVITASYVGSGERIATADKNGDISLTMNNERIYDVITSINGLSDYWIRYSLTARNFGTAAPVGFEAGDNYAELVNVFTSGNALFMGECLAVVEDMRDSSIDFGIVPSPKLDEQQEDYYSAVNYIAAAMCVPKTVTNLERTSIIVEAWAAESHYTVLPAYYEVAMKSKYARDTISSEMLDLILGSRSYDLGIYYDWGQLSGRFCSLVYNGSDAFASMYDSYQASAQKALDEFVGALE